ncbi:hypothetical protein [Microbulbifer agarilyticus]|uniref:hypothetical protein n=1 Tax=Microbulbifer agarilyticus TaxID=260552 RepID=UPI0018DE5CD2|nr:hypothetical protein [Microbulbifer agarilyticus]
MPLTASGGVKVGSIICPAEPHDTIVPVVIPSDVHDAASAPEMTIAGLWGLIQQQGLTSIDQLLPYLPDHFRTNFSLVEHTRATGQSNLEFPRVVLFGSDGHLLLNIGTKPDDPKYNLLDVAQLHEGSGRWEFSVFDFSSERPRLMRNDASCIECHGADNSRPVWGTNLDWPGVFGDNIAAGPQGEALDSRHLEQIHAIMAGDGKSSRFDFLEWRHEPLRRGGKRRIARHAFGAELILSNIAMGSATARGVFQRLRSENLQHFRQQRMALLYSYFARKGHLPWGEGNARLLGLTPDTSAEQAMDKLLAHLGVDTSEAFSVATLHLLEPAQTHWSMGRGDLYDLVALQVLDDLKREDAEVAAILAGRKVAEGVLGCPVTAGSVAEVVDFKMLHLFYLRGHARFLVHEQFYPLDLEDVYSRVFLPVAHPLLSYLGESLQIQASVPDGRGAG